MNRLAPGIEEVLAKEKKPVAEIPLAPEVLAKDAPEREGEDLSQDREREEFVEVRQEENVEVKNYTMVEVLPNNKTEESQRLQMMAQIGCGAKTSPQRSGKRDVQPGGDEMVSRSWDYSNLHIWCRFRAQWQSGSRDRDDPQGHQRDHDGFQGCRKTLATNGEAHRRKTGENEARSVGL